ncbi:hypothetical protein EVAR_20791_1 [Eumeta japonica]|uniref:Uncharacterized protein n=1 Tax=Eumeta variegata TaxID=151549 RepID=A0A4C1UEC8_EUMVA|nr:hypothetical protein EVAR_20791_1 [Eumeta japonica]
MHRRMHKCSTYALSLSPRPRISYLALPDIHSCSARATNPNSPRMCRREPNPGRRTVAGAGAVVATARARPMFSPIRRQTSDAKSAFDLQALDTGSAREDATTDRCRRRDDGYRNH